MAKQRFLSLISLMASFFALGVIALGAFTRLKDAGLGCPDWPGCYGHLIVASSSYKAWAEMIHRYFVGCLSIFIVGIAIILCIRTKKQNTPINNRVLGAGLIILLTYQIMLGMWTVTLKLLPIIVTQHLLGGLLILSLLWVIYLNNQQLNNRMAGGLGRGYWGAGLLGLVLLFCQILLGAWTSTNYAALSCSDFPLCMNNQAMVFHLKEAFNLFSSVGINYDGGVLPDAVRQTIQMVHRLGALVLTLYFFVLGLIVVKKLVHFPERLKIIYVIFGLLVVQISLGIMNVLFKLPLITALAHTVVAALLLLTVITFLFQAKGQTHE